MLERDMAGVLGSEPAPLGVEFVFAALLAAVDAGVGVLLAGAAVGVDGRAGSVMML